MISMVERLRKAMRKPVAPSPVSLQAHIDLLMPALLTWSGEASKQYPNIPPISISLNANHATDCIEVMIRNIAPKGEFLLACLLSRQEIDDNLYSLVWPRINEAVDAFIGRNTDPKVNTNYLTGLHEAQDYIEQNS